MTGSVTTGTLVRSARVGQQRRQAGVEPSRLSPDGGSRARNVGGTGRVLRSRGDAGAPGIRAAHTRRRRLARTRSISRGYWLVRSEVVWSRWNVPVRDAGRQHERRRARRLGRRALPRDAPHRRLRPRRPAGFLTPRRRSESDADVGRERLARRSRRRLLHSTQPHGPMSPCSTTIGTAGASASARTSPARSPTGSDALQDAIRSSSSPSPLALLAATAGARVSTSRDATADVVNGTDPGPCGAAAAARRSGATPACRRRRDAAGARSHRPPPERRVSRDRAQGRVRPARRAARQARPAQRSVRAARPGDRRGHDGRLSQQRQDLPQRVLALAHQAVRPRAIRGRAGRRPSSSIVPASSACSATSIRT